VWTYTIGSYQVIKKWLSYREKPLLGRGQVALELDRERCDQAGCREAWDLSRGERQLALDVQAVLRGQLAQVR